MTIPKPIFPREHGAWAVLFVPMIIGASIAGSFSVEILFLALSALVAFLGTVPLYVILRNWTGEIQAPEKLVKARRWGVMCLVAGVLFLIPLLAKGFWWLLLLGSLGAGFFLMNFFLTRSNPKTIASDLVAVAGLTLSASGAYYVRTGRVDETAPVLWLMSFLFFGSSVFYVHMKMRARGLKRGKLFFCERASLGVWNVAYHAVAIGIVIMLSVQHYTTEFALFAYVPITVHAIIGTLRLSSRVRFKKLGFVLVGQSILFAFLLIAAGG